jgi:hypothetical protein
MRLLMSHEARQLDHQLRPREIDAGAYSGAHSLPLVEDGSQVRPRVSACNGRKLSLRKTEVAQAEAAPHEPAEVVLLRVEDVTNVLDRRPVPVRRPRIECRWFELLQQRAKPRLMFVHHYESVSRTNLFHVRPRSRADHAVATLTD